jgi:membrane protein insertase Oxa1/YidC/SpoIIIJ
MLNPNFFNTFFVIPILNILMIFYKAFSFIKIPGALGWSMIGLTVFVRFLLHPFLNNSCKPQKNAGVKTSLDKLSQNIKKSPKNFKKSR